MGYHQSWVYDGDKFDTINILIPWGKHIEHVDSI